MDRRLEVTCLFLMKVTFSGYASLQVTRPPKLEVHVTCPQQSGPQVTRPRQSGLEVTRPISQKWMYQLSEVAAATK